jgi:peptidylprolyl isomerase
MRKLALALWLLGSPAFATGLEIDVAGDAQGTIVIDLFEDIAPQHVERITTLAAEGAYDDVVFHRVIDGFMAQTGDVEFGRMGQDMRYAGRGGSEYPDLPAEFSDIPYERGIVGMARAQDPNSANSQFFIMFEAAPPLNGQYTVVGEVVSGMEVVDLIKRGRGRNGAVIGEPDRMVDLRVLEEDPVPPEGEPEEGAEEG